MTAYRRVRIAGATWFFTVNLAERRDNHLLINNIDLLRQAFCKIKKDHPFDIDAMVVLPDHLHCIWILPPGDADYKTRWALIKAGFSRGIPPGERRLPKPHAKGRARHLATPILGTSDPG